MININTTKRRFIELAKEAGITRKLALLFLSKLNNTVAKNNILTINPVRKPKLKSVLNPNSKYYDSTPNLTNKISLIFYMHQQTHKRYKHKRITKKDRQWVLLVQIKEAIVNIVGDNPNKIMSFAKKLFQEAEKMTYKFSKRNLYLTFVVSRLEELVDIVNDTNTLKVSVRERKLWRAYRIRRERITGIAIENDLSPGSNEHLLITKLAKMIRKYKISSKMFMDIQFKAFEVFDSFPRLKDLITDNAIDRLEQNLIKYKKDSYSNEKEEAYWKDVKNKAVKTK